MGVRKGGTSTSIEVIGRPWISISLKWAALGDFEQMSGSELHFNRMSLAAVLGLDCRK